MNLRYQGGKSRIAKELSEFLTPPERGSAFVSLFCGACTVESRIAGFETMILNDKHPYLIALLRAVQAGYEPPGVVTEEEYQFIRAHKDLFPALAGFAGFACSFGGKWFGGYARDAAGCNYADVGRKSLLKTMANLENARFTNLDYRDVPIPSGSVIYADPPYADTTGYSRETFDSSAFWDYARSLAKNGHRVFVSEQKAPEGWVSVWESPLKRQLDRNKQNIFTVTEKLYVYNE